MNKKQTETSVRVTERSLFYWILRRHRGMQLILLVVIVVSLFFKVFPLEMQKRIINRAIYLQDIDLLFLYCGLYIGAVTIAGLLKYAINVLQVSIGQKILVEMRNELYNHVLQLPLQFYRKMQAGTVISAMTAELNTIGFFLGGAIAIPVTSILTFLVFLIFMINLNPWLALLSTGIYPVELFVIPWLQKKYNNLNKKRVQTTRKMSNVVNEAITGIHEIHGNASYGLEERKLSSFVDKLYALMRRLFLVKYGIKFANNLFQSFGPFFLFLVGGYMAIHGQFTIGALVAFLSAYEKIYDPWKEMIEYYQSYQDAQIRYAQIMSIFDLDPPHLLLPDNRELLTLQGNLQLNNVSFSVPGGVTLLEDINLTVKANEQIALVGYSGSGKSTLALLIAQLYDASKGTISIDGHDIEAMSKADIGKNVAMIAQQPFIFSGTISENLLYGIKSIAGRVESVERAEIMEVVRQVGLQNDILRFGLQSVITPEKCRAFKQKFLRMRQIVCTTLRSEFENVIEFYDAQKYLYYSNIRDNIVFGDSLTGEFTIEHLPENKPFLKLLRDLSLEKPLMTLGYAIATQTVALLADFYDDEFFFRHNPMEMVEYRTYQQLLERMKGPVPEDSEARRLLLTLALRFIPKKHTIVSFPSALAEKILLARRGFQKQIVFIEPCQDHGEFALKPVSPQTDEEPTFIPFCPSEYLYSRTLRDNILFGAVKSEDILNDHFRELAASAFEDEQLLEEIMEIGLEFDVGSRGDRLSGGQKQKLAIARAFLKDAPIIILDEATASLDNSSQARIQGLLESKYKGKKTVIAVIHRLDLTPAYDRIFMMKSGRIVEQGSYDELMAKKGDFYALARTES